MPEPARSSADDADASPRSTSIAPGAPTRTPPGTRAGRAASRTCACSRRRFAAIGFVLLATSRGGLPAALLAGFGPGCSSHWPSITPASSAAASGPPVTPSSTAKRWRGSSAAGTRCRRRGSPARSMIIRTPPTSTCSATPRSRSSPDRCTRRPAAVRWRPGCWRSTRPRSPPSATVRQPSRSSPRRSTSARI